MNTNFTIYSNFLFWLNINELLAELIVGTVTELLEEKFREILISLDAREIQE